MGDNSFALEFRLRELDPELHRRFTNCVFALQRILSNYKLIFPEYTDHSELHSITVIDFCRRLIGNQIEKLDKDELYVLLLSCYFHDSGMGITQKDYEAFSKQIDFGSYFELHPNATQADQIRDFHNEYSGLFIRKYEVTEKQICWMSMFIPLNCRHRMVTKYVLRTWQRLCAWLMK